MALIPLNQKTAPTIYSLMRSRYTRSDLTSQDMVGATSEGAGRKAMQPLNGHGSPFCLYLCKWRQAFEEKHWCSTDGALVFECFVYLVLRSRVVRSLEGQMGAYFELAQGSSVRLCRKLEKQFPDLRGWQLELMNYLCFVAYNSEIYDGVCEDAWLRTTITVEENPNPIFSEESLERNLMARITIRSQVPAYWRMLQEFHSGLTARIKIHSNILPREAYREKLAQELRRQSLWTRLWSRSSCCVNRRWFYPSRVLAEAVSEQRSLMDKMQEWSNKGEMCVLAKHLQSNNAPHARSRESLRDVDPAEVTLTTENLLGQGSEGRVVKVSWRNGTYARKSFNGESFKTECAIASRILHPHIVHPFGRTLDEDGNHKCLLMEVLSEDLRKFALEKLRCRHPLFSRVDALDVLRQIASAMSFLHSKNIIHGDLKPDNILISHFEISENSRHFLSKIADFGNAQFIVSEESFRAVGHGTRGYAAPELLKGRKKTDMSYLYPKKLDVYSFGVVAYELLTGQLGYNGLPNIERIMQGELKPNDSAKWLMRRRCPAELIDLLESCWEFDPPKRPSFPELHEALLKAKSKIQRWERQAADLRSFLARCFFACVIVFVAMWFQRFADRILFS